ncbi:hypothetical protein DFR24_3575 [Panacagrimonas perspica]|uniref:Uncharacterized protein n=1 Tax=Panacagrimonas perspica TaxID=381431 RepID=A0A4V3F4V2_9GAMM|nr:hypothetical protein [Panacagrimonas perspica]TDU26546.1 hypothetical protein DFR24_3575 [Panacagrimonas perspica]THD03915.1 hypothetical protein B1810_06500 [Panacagrimonas perspica]
MSLIDRLRTRIDALAAGALGASGDDRLSFKAEIPAGVFGSILKLDVTVDTEAHGDGERVRLRAHVQTNFASVLRPMLAAPPPPPKPRRRGKQKGASASRALAPAASFVGQLARRGVRRAFANPIVQRLAEPLMKHDINSWIEISASTASLDRGAHDLIPKSDKLESMGIRPARHDGPHVESWSGATAQGSAQVSTLQIDKKSLPKNLQKRLGDQPFNLAAMIINTIEEK